MPFIGERRSWLIFTCLVGVFFSPSYLRSSCVLANIRGGWRGSRGLVPLSGTGLAGPRLTSLLFCTILEGAGSGPRAGSTFCDASLEVLCSQGARYDTINGSSGLLLNGRYLGLGLPTRLSAGVGLPCSLGQGRGVGTQDVQRVL